jgi:hypothetical protein
VKHEMRYLFYVKRDLRRYFLWNVNSKFVSYHWILCVVDVTLGRPIIDQYKYYISKTNSVWSFKPITVRKLRHFSAYKQANLFTAYYIPWNMKWKIFSSWIVKIPVIRVIKRDQYHLPLAPSFIGWWDIYKK